MIGPLEALRGQSERIVAIRSQVAQLLARETRARRLPPILILGETGTGKGLLARAIHQASARREGPFVDVNCAAIPETLLEAELFGYERGAFTDARIAKPGLFQTANTGTLFLDEIGLLPTALQGKLLTVLEDRAVRRLGSTRAEAVDVALVAATSVDLTRAVKEGRFREDLYHRLAGIMLDLPPLRARGSDVLVLAEQFLARACADYGLSPRALTPEARHVLSAYRWPGNVRELANAMERVALLADRDEITPAMLGFLPPSDGGSATNEGEATGVGSLEDALRGRIEAALHATGGNIQRTAAALGISRNTLRARMDKYGLRRDDAPRPLTPRPMPEADAAVAPQWERCHLAFLRVRILASAPVDVARALDVVGEKVRAFGGRIEASSPTGVIAVFGLEPVDNPPSHATLAALAIQKAGARARTASGDGAHFVIAIHGADQVVGRHASPPVIGIDGQAATWSILETLVSADVSGAIFASGPTAPFLRRRFALERADNREPNAWLVLRAEELHAGSNVTRFVGRTVELSMLQQAASLAVGRHGQIVGIVGEAGVGKSRLIHEAVRPLQGWRVLASGGAPYAQNASYFPLVEILKRLYRIQDTETAAEARARVAAALPADAGADSLGPPILDLLEVLPPDDAFRKVEPAQRRKRTHDALRRVLLTVSIEQPLCLIIEDLHWIDTETRDVLDSLVNSLTGSRVLLLVSYRPEYQHSWGGKTLYSQLRLDALPAEAARELLDVLLGEDLGLAPLKQLLVRRGNPFFLEETVRTLVETNALAGERGRYRLTQSIQAIQVPATVHAMLAARIDRLPSDDKRLLQTASVIGKDLPFALLQAVADLPDDVLRRGLSHLQAAEFLHETSLYPDSEYTFKHALTHEVVYGSLLEERRRSLHARIVAAIETQLGPHADGGEEWAKAVTTLAYHAFRGGQWERAVTWLRRAGIKAALRSAGAEAVARFGQALEALAHLPKTRANLELAMDLRFELRNPLFLLADFPRALTLLEEVKEMAEAIDDPNRLGRACAFMANAHFMLGNTERGIALAERARLLGEQLSNASLLAVAWCHFGQLHYVRGDHAAAVSAMATCMDRLGAEVVPRRGGVVQTYSVVAECFVAMAEASRGRFNDALAAADRCVTIAGENRFYGALARWARGVVHLTRGDVKPALTMLEAASADCDAADILSIRPWIAADLGLALALEGRGEEAVKVLESAVADAASLQLFAGQSLRVSRLAEALLAAGRDVEDARLTAARAVELAEQHGEQGFRAWSLRLQGELAMQAGDLEAAAGHLQEALAAGERHEMAPLVARCHLDLAALRARTGDGMAAERTLATAIAMFRELDMPSWRARAESLALA